jgi:hypothetical protein
MNSQVPAASSAASPSQHQPLKWWQRVALWRVTRAARIWLAAVLAGWGVASFAVSLDILLGTYDPSSITWADVLSELGACLLVVAISTGVGAGVYLVLRVVLTCSSMSAPEKRRLSGFLMVVVIAMATTVLAFYWNEVSLLIVDWIRSILGGATVPVVAITGVVFFWLSKWAGPGLFSLLINAVRRALMNPAALTPPQAPANASGVPGQSQGSGSTQQQQQQQQQQAQAQPQPQPQAQVASPPAGGTPPTT